MRRRAFLALAAGAPLLAAPAAIKLSRQDAPPRSAAAAIATQVREQLTGPSLVRVPALAADGYLPVASISAFQAYQGGALRVMVENAVSGNALAFDRVYPLGQLGNVAEGYVGFGTEDPPGAMTVSVDAVEASGQAFRYDFVVRILATQWTFDDIIIPPAPPPDPNAPEPPPPPPDEGPLLPGIYAGITPRKWANRWRLPLDGEPRVTGYFGEERSFNGGPRGGHHGGTDFGVEAGTPIRSTNDGVVVMSGLYRTRGNIVIVDHGAGIFSLYGHLQERAVSVGQAVQHSDVVGYVGSTGLSTGPHLHWELSVSGVLVDGLRWLDGSQGF
ncbi:MAG: M23 family metallopeptidase [Dehalococcoidia bacterium]|nr:M23 family metallopeptidase [Dehalococcoidia bacterium]